jgi:hypothetical protein
MTKEKICADCKKWEMGETWGTGRGKTIVECRGWCCKTPWRKPRWNYQPVCGSFDPREQTSLILHGQGYPTEEQLQEIDDEIRNFLNKDNMEQQEQPKRDKAAEYAEVVGRCFRPTFDSPIDYFEIRGYDAERDMVLTTAHPKQGDPFDDEIEEVYLMGAFENGDYKAINPYSRGAGEFPETMVLHNYDMPPAPPVRKQKFCGPCCDRCQHRFGTTSNRDWCSSHYENDKCYRFKLEKQ